MAARNYIVFGANGGIGSEVCKRLSEAGGRVLLAGRNEEALRRLGGVLDAPHYVVDAISLDEVEQCATKAPELLGGPLFGVVNCVGSVLLKPLHLTTAAEWHATLETNLTSAFSVVRASVKAMRQSGGSIVLLSSAAAQMGFSNHEAIAAAKAGVIGLMRSAAASYASRNIRVNAVAPGLVQTAMTERIWSHPKSAEISRNMHALGRLGEPKDIASLITWLLQPENDWITGQVYGVDGGLATLNVASRS